MDLGKQFESIVGGVSEAERARMGILAEMGAKEDALNSLPSHMVKKDILGAYTKFKTHGDQFTHIWDGGRTMEHYHTALGMDNGYLGSSSTAGMDATEAGVHKHAYDSIKQMFPGFPGVE